MASSNEDIFMDGFNTGDLLENPHRDESSQWELWEFGAYVKELVKDWNDTP